MTENAHDPKVAAILAAAAAPAEAPLPGELAALAAFREVHHPRRRFALMSRKSENAKVVAAAVFGGLVVLSGAAAAATGAIPVGHSSSHPSHVAKSHAPDANDDNGTDSTDASDSADTTTGSVSTLDQTQGNGSAISQLAHSLKGQQHKGQTICIVASKGHCHAAQNQSGTTTHGKSALPHGKAGATTHGQSGATTHGQAGATTHGQAGATTHGQAGATTHGNAGANSTTS